MNHRVTETRPSPARYTLSILATCLCLFSPPSLAGEISVEGDTTVLTLDLHAWVFPDPSKTDTASRADVMAFRPLADRATQVIAAMNKMSVEMDLDCGNCSFAPVCEAVEGLRAMRRARENKHA